MTQTNVNQIKRSLQNRPEVEQLTVDGDASANEAIFRTIVDDQSAEEFIDFVESTSAFDVSVTRDRWVVFGREVVLQ